ncbi:MAG TPA: hypothetical protein VD836_00150 [Solirubrobacteraceae bacterium]|nr:hypothetical protein [Solirubrobacteraceae bacterium]
MRRRAALPLALAVPVAAAGAAALAAEPGGDTSTAAPEQGRSVVLEPVSGDVEVRPEGSTRYRDLTGRRRHRVGVTVDAQEGAVRLIVSRGGGAVSKAVFSEGKFTVTQERGDDPLVTLTLTGPSYADVCDGASAARKRRQRVRRLWGDGKGSFRTSGRYSAATVRGTRWLTEDRCDGTVTRVVRGSVEVDDFLRDAPAPSPTPTPTPGPPPPAGGEPPLAPPEPVGGGGEGDPSVRPAPQDAEGDVIVSSGGTYVARP